MCKLLSQMNERLSEEWAEDPFHCLESTDSTVASSEQIFFQKLVTVVYTCVQMAWRIMRQYNVKGIKTSAALKTFILQSWTSLFFVCRSLSSRFGISNPASPIGKRLCDDHAQQSNAEAQDEHSTDAHDTNSEGDEPPSPTDLVTDIFTFIHEQLGEISMCTSDNGTMASMIH
jgi:hypothetical protein